MATERERELRKHFERRLAVLKKTRKPFEEDWRQVSQYCAPRRSRFLCEQVDQNNRSNRKILNNVGLRDSQICSRGMTAGMATRSRPWFKLTLEDKALAGHQPVKVWLAEVTERLYAAFARSNFYSANKVGYHEQALFGIEACFITEDWRSGATFHPLTAGEFWIGLGTNNAPDTLYREVPMTVAQQVETFGKHRVTKQVRDLYDKSSLDERAPVYHAVEPNRWRAPDRLDGPNKEWISAYWDPNGEGLLKTEGFTDQPFYAPRWDVTGSETYGDSPGMNALPDLKQIQLKELRLTQAQDYENRPPLGGPPALRGAHVSLQPGSLNALSGLDGAAGVKPLWEVKANTEHRIADIQRKEEAVHAAFHADLFMAIIQTAVRDRTAREVDGIDEEKLTQLGPVVERNENEKHRIAIDRMFGLLLRSGQLPPAPEVMQGQELKVEFVSLLANMQKAAGLRGLERALGFAGNLAGIKPEVLDKIDEDKAIDAFADMADTPPSIIRADDAVDKIRQARAQQQQAAQLAAAAQPTLQGVQAAKLLSETDLGDGTTALQRLAGAA